MVHDIFYYFIDVVTLVKQQFVKSYIHDFSFSRAVELIIFTVGFIQIHLAVKEKSVAWLLVIFNCTLLMYIWGSKGIIGQVLLYAFLLLNAALAFEGWKKRDKDNNFVVKLKVQKIHKSIVQVLLLCILIFVIVNIIEFLKVKIGLNSNQTVRDICILVFTIYAFTLQRHKYIESWFYLVIIDINVALFYIDLGLYMLALIRSYITIITIYGLFKWFNKYRKELLEKSGTLEKQFE